LRSEAVVVFLCAKCGFTLAEKDFVRQRFFFEGVTVPCECARELKNALCQWPNDKLYAESNVHPISYAHASGCQHFCKN